MDIQNFLTEAYSKIFENAEDIFPEFQFKPLPNNRGYCSSNQHKIDGSTGNKVGGVYYYAVLPFGIKDYTRGFVSIYNYIKQRDKLDDREVIDRLATLSGIPRPKRVLTAEDEHNYRQQARRAEMLEAANTFFINSLSHKDFEQAKSPRAVALREYLVNKRKFKPTNMRMPEAEYRSRHSTKMEIGYMPSLKMLNKHLREKGYQQPEIQQTIRLPKSVGYTHTLTIPYRNKIGMIKGFVFRNIQHDKNSKSPKYLYSIGLERSSILFGLRAVRGSGDLVIVEGVLDALNARANGMENVVAIGGASLTYQQSLEAINAKPSSITLCLDSDQAGKIGTERAINKLLPHSDSFGLYIAPLPEGIKDLDQLISERGIDNARQVIQNAISIADHFALKLKAEVEALQGNNPNIIPSKTVNYLLRRIAEIETQLKNPVDIRRFRQKILHHFETFNLSPDLIAFKSENVREIQKKKHYLDQLSQLNLDISDAIMHGETARAEELHEERFLAIQDINRTQQLFNLTIPQTEDSLKTLLQTRPVHIDSGFLVKDRQGQSSNLLLPSAALSFFCLPPSQGKTTLLSNLALNLATSNLGQEVHFFSYKEAQGPLSLRFLNTFLELDLGINNMYCLENYYNLGELAALDETAQKAFDSRRKKFFEQYLGTQALNIHSVDYSVEKLVEAIGYLHNKKGDKITAVFIDYLQLLQTHSAEYKSRKEALKSICLQLKACAIKTGLPLILGAQFNREVGNHCQMQIDRIAESDVVGDLAALVVGLWNNAFAARNVSAANRERISQISQPNSMFMQVLKSRSERRGKEALLLYNSNRQKIYV